MEKAFRETIGRLPQIIERNAPGMMKRMLVRIKEQITQGENSDNTGHGQLFLKVGEDDLVNQFAAAAHSTFAKKEDSELAGLSLEPESGSIDAEFAGSMAAFDKLRESAGKLGVGSLDRYNKDAFLKAMMDAFKQARMDERATDELVPFARAALDVELQAFYSKLDDLAVKVGG